MTSFHFDLLLIFSCRFCQIAENIASDGVSVENLLAAVQIETCYHIDNAFESIDRTIPAMCQANKNIKLVIIDRFVSRHN